MTKTNGIWTDRGGFAIAVHGEAGDIWPNESTMTAQCLPVATYEPTAWDERDNETEWQVIHNGVINGVIVFPVAS